MHACKNNTGMKERKCTGSGTWNMYPQENAGMLPEYVWVGSWVDLNLAGDAKNNNKGFCRYVGQKIKGFF